MSLGVFLMSLGVGLEHELGDEFGVEFDAFDEFGGAFVAFGDAFDEFGDAFDEFAWVWNRRLEMNFEVVLMSLMSLGLRLPCVCCIWRCV